MLLELETHCDGVALKDALCELVLVRDARCEDVTLPVPETPRDGVWLNVPLTERELLGVAHQVAESERDAMPLLDTLSCPERDEV